MTKVMIVDDSRFMCDEIKHMLQDSDFEVVATCRDASQAMEVYNQHTPDIVLMDIVLPGIDGIEATEVLLTKWPLAKVVIITSLAYDDTIAHARKIGAKSLLFKPIEKDMLLDSLQQVLTAE